MTRIPIVRRQESGFALLVIFLIAAAMAFTMYQELPRAAFESARDKEQVLMDRGNQYKRAIQVFYAVNKRYPAEIKDLENTGNKRFLRRRYVDPMTGQDLGDERRLEIAVLVRQRVDGRIKQILRNGKLARELR